jgi:hypothetical protein
VYTRNGEPSGIQTAAYFFADARPRSGRITVRSSTCQMACGISTTRGSDRNSAR